jgi:hypothetical protein
MQQLILLLTSFFLGCGFPAFLIGFYSVNGCRDKDKDRRRETGGIDQVERHLLSLLPPRRR